MKPADPDPDPRPDDASASPTVALPPSAVLALKMLLAALIIAALWFGEPILVPFALAGLLSFILDPLVTRFARWGLPRVAAVVLVVMGAVGVIGGTGVYVGNELSELARDLPRYQTTIRDKLRTIRHSISGPGVIDEASKVIDVVGEEVEAARQERESKSPAAANARRNVQRVQVVPSPPTGLDAVRAYVAPVLAPLTTAGIVLVFVIFILLERSSLRDRLLRLVGGDLHRMTDALNDAAHRVSRFLTLQLFVNTSYGVIMGVALWLIGVPGAVLWGVVSGVMRFVPYVGPVIAAVAPLTIAFAVDPGWDMLLWTAGLIIVMELILNNVVEPVVYGNTAGIAPVAVLLAAAFWTLLWGPVGLILATPLTLCLVVVGRHIPQLQFLDVLLGSEEVFDAPTRLYQRLLAGDPEGASELALQEADEHGLQAFYNDTGVPTLARSAGDHVQVSSTLHRHRVASGMAAVLAELRDEHPTPAAQGAAKVLVIGARWEVDTLAAEMVAHALGAEGVAASHLPPAALAADRLAALDLTGIQVVVLSAFSPTPETHARYVTRRLHRVRPGLRIVLALWQGPPALLELGAADALGADSVATSLTEVVLRVQALLAPSPAPMMPAPIPDDDEARLLALHASGALAPAMREAFDRAAQQVADVFDTRMAIVSLVDRSCQIWHGATGLPAGGEGDARVSPRDTSLCGHVVATHETMVVPDIHRDPRFAANPVLREAGMRFYAGVPLRTADNHVIGALAIMDPQPRVLSEREVQLLESMAAEVMATLDESRHGAAADGDAPSPAPRPDDAPQPAPS
jgi:predicted PurR-regulated permease PerM/GAF domain-containing protein